MDETWKKTANLWAVENLSVLKAGDQFRIREGNNSPILLAKKEVASSLLPKL